jgi:type 1 glutamine amidotransferase
MNASIIHVIVPIHEQLEVPSEDLAQRYLVIVGQTQVHVGVACWPRRRGDLLREQVDFVVFTIGGFYLRHPRKFNPFQIVCIVNFHREKWIDGFAVDKDQILRFANLNVH